MARRWLASGTAPPPAAAAAGTESGPPAPHLQWNLHRPAVKIAIFGNVLIVVLLLVAVVWRLFFPAKGKEGIVDPEGEGAAGGGSWAATGQQDVSSSGMASPCVEPRATGMRKVDLMALPMYVHRAAEEGGKVECAVCICEFRDGDTSRLLPRCGHRFHVECVDRWFRSQATCPLCRVVVANDVSGEANPGRNQD